MNITFRPAVRENVGLLIGLAGESGSGKTYSAMRLAAGISGGKPFAVIDTESRRALHYADEFKFDHAELRPPFRPEAYQDTILAANAAGYPAIVVDSMSHEWAGEGGVLDWQEAELDRMAGQDWGKRERVKMAAWIKPKMAHKQMVQRLLQVRAHLILCFRAEEKLEMVKDDKGKTVIGKRQGITGLDGWFPICEKNLPYELTAFFLLRSTNPGYGMPIKLQNQHRSLFPSDKPIGEDSGRLVAAWAAGGASAPAPDPAPEPPSAGPGGHAHPPAQVLGAGQSVLTPDQVMTLEAKCLECQISVSELRKAAKVERLAQIKADNYDRCLSWIDKAYKARTNA